MSELMMRRPVTRGTTAVSWFALAMILATGVVCWPSVLMAGDAPRKKMDCRVYETKTTSFGVGLKFGAMLLPLLGPVSPSVSVTPLASFDQKTGVQWDKAVHGIIARYVELCNRYNARLVDKEEYEARMKEIDGLYKEAQEVEGKLFEATRTHAKQAADDLSQELGRKKAAAASTQGEGGPAASQQLTQSVQALADRVDRLEPISRPFDPSRTSSMPPDPMKPPATTGTVGASPGDSPRQP